ncbi:hypothetical protein JAAARDRAFT_188405 [Jaapia argillacea MUCL 33604]|uniref:Uncharacterized protein n=1 Tax=Jaapia argillacea MUCL 33604 TaxID=933084 RepID=A0A067QDL8_9AGAM|nr:hypothetical protein JAAARDRAFT_188405 [Jaapia argillacea MUCL 33604]
MLSPECRRTPSQQCPDPVPFGLPPGRAAPAHVGGDVFGAPPPHVPRPPGWPQPYDFFGFGLREQMNNLLLLQPVRGRRGAPAHLLWLGHLIQQLNIPTCPNICKLNWPTWLHCNPCIKGENPLIPEQIHNMSLRIYVLSLLTWLL